MRLTRLRAQNFLAFGSVDIPFDRDLTVIVGPNGAGKSTVVRAIDFVHTVISAASYTDTPWTQVDSEYTLAGHRGAQDFEVRLGVEFDRPDEQQLILTWFQVAFRSAFDVNSGQGQAHDLERQICAAIDLDGVAPLFTGTIVVQRRDARRQSWTAAYEFDLDSTTASAAMIGLVGELDDGLVPGTLGGHVGPITSRLGDHYWTLPGEPRLKDEKLTITDIVGRGGVAHLAAQRLHASEEPVATRTLFDAVGLRGDPQRAVMFPLILTRLLDRGLTLTDNHRAPMITSYQGVPALDQPRIRDGSEVPAAFAAAKNGDAHHRARYQMMTEFFETIAGSRLEVRVQTLTDSGTTLIEPVITEDGHVDVPLRFAGAGAEEAAFLSVLLAEDQPVLMLDEPATNLSTTAQSRLLTTLIRTSGARQTVLITHSPGLVPTRTADDLQAIVRLTRGTAGTATHHLDSARISEAGPRFQQLLGSADARAMLFAAGVWLLEGDTELGALTEWLADSTATRLPTPEQANVHLVNVGSQTAFGKHIELCDAFGLPWAVLADAPALAAGSDLEKQLAEQGARGTTRLGPAPDDPADFHAMKVRYEGVGVYTVADGFPDPAAPKPKKGEPKAGEIEQWFAHLDPAAWAEARAQYGRSKPRIGKAFAENVTVPAELVTLWGRILDRLTSPRDV
jgi:ABC-type transport system involved in cytochrome c biogenesis ATPase subunit